MTEQKTNQERHKQVCYELNAIYDKKNRDYGDSFHTSWTDYGITMAAIRIGDKYNRLKTLVSGHLVPNVADESIRDTLIDLANYSIMTVMELDRESDGKPVAGAVQARQTYYVRADPEVDKALFQKAIGPVKVYEQKPVNREWLKDEQEDDT